jgi:glycosyltransferase involved in cell wall biosynthesis
MPSFEEPFGMVFLEAMALERPVVAVRNGGTPEVVEENVTGLLSEPGDIEGLACNMLRLARDPELRRCMGEAGRARVEEHFLPERLARDVEAIYDRLLASK